MTSKIPAGIFGTPQERAKRMNEAEIYRYTLDFARLASETAWSPQVLSAFFDRSGVSKEAQTTYWPEGTRSMGQWLNKYADSNMAERASRLPYANLEQVLWDRFEQNSDLKASVGQLAKNDLIHPFDTIARTFKTTSLMCHYAGLGNSPLRAAALVVLYSVCVLIWLWERGAPYRLTRKAVSVASRLVGAS